MIRKPFWKPCILAAAIAALASPAARADNFQFNAGNYGAPNPITAADSVTAGLGGDKNFVSISLTNAGSFYWTVADRLGFASSLLTNNNVFDIQADASLTYIGGNASSFVNNATFQKSGGGASTTIGGNVNFTNNAGIINAASGTIDFAGGSATFDTGTQFNGGGVNRVSNNASFNGAISSVNLLLAGGTFSGNNAVATGTVDWTGGNMSGTWSLASGHTLNAKAGGDKNFSSTTFVNHGTLNWQTANRIGFASSAITNNGLFDIQADANLTYIGGNASTFTNASTGIFRKSGGAGTTSVGSNVAFTNDGGVINAANGIIDFAGGSATFNANTQFTGAGINRVSNNASFNGGFASVNLQLTAGTFSGTNAAISGAVDWTGGNISGGWTLAPGQTLNAKAGGDKNFSGTTFVNNGTLNWQTVDRIGFASSTVTNSSLFDIQADANLTYVGGNASTFTNASTGIFRKSGGAGTTSVGGNVVFTNNGGVIDAASGTIDFAGGSATFNANTQFTGVGINRVSNNASFAGGFTAGNLLLSAGTFSGNAAAMSGTVDWTGGSMSGGWAVASGQTLNATAGGDKNFLNTTFANNGTLNWQTANRIGFVSSAITNHSLFDIQADANLTYAGGNASTFTNASTGIFRKSGGAGTTSVGGNVVFTNNGGVINAASGTIDFAGGSATFNANTQFTGAGINRVSNNASFVGGFTAGNLQLTAGTFSGSAAAISGTVDWTGGNMSGGWAVVAGQTLNAKAGDDKNFSGTTFVNNGTLNWQTANRIGFVSSAITNNGLFDIQADANLTYAGGNASTFTNAGTLRKSGGDGSTVVGTNVVFSNPGVIEARSGTLVLPANFLNPGTITGGATIQTTKLTNSGHVAPGNSPGTLTLAGNFEQTAAGVLDIELASSVLFDKFAVNGTAALGGTLALSCVGGCSLNANDTFVILDSTGDLSGTFGSVTATGFGSGFDYSVRYDYAADLVELRVIQPGVPLPVPEPETWAMLIAGLGLVGAIARRQGKSRSIES